MFGCGELRCAIYQDMMRGKTRRYIWEVARVSPESPATFVEDLFKGYATRADSAKTQEEVEGAVSSFIEEGRVPEFVAQCCSADVVKARAGK